MNRYLVSTNLKDSYICAETPAEAITEFLSNYGWFDQEEIRIKLEPEPDETIDQIDLYNKIIEKIENESKARIEEHEVLNTKLNILKEQNKIINQKLDYLVRRQYGEEDLAILKQLVKEDNYRKPK